MDVTEVGTGEPSRQITQTFETNTTSQTPGQNTNTQIQAVTVHKKGRNRQTGADYSNSRNKFPHIYVVFEEMVRSKNDSPSVLLGIREGENSQRLFKHIERQESIAV